jgi:hypothetical protein
MYCRLTIMLDVRQMYLYNRVWLVGCVWRVSHPSFAVAVQCMCVHHSVCRAIMLRRDAVRGCMVVSLTAVRGRCCTCVYGAS